MADALRFCRRIRNELSRDRSDTKAASGRVIAASRGVLGLLIALALALPAYGQISPEEHASHHPGEAAGTPPAAGAGAAPAATSGSANGLGGGMGGRPGNAGPPEGAGGMMGGGGMGGMMEKMGAPKPKDFYPTLMNLPDLPRAQRLEVEQQAGERLHAGVVLMNEGLDYLLQATEQQNYIAMQAGTASLREGLARFESGLAAQRALAEGKAPRNVALTWFKREMNLAYPMPSDAPGGLLGATPFHFLAMGLLIVFALTMVAMYFFKMRRAAALFGRIEAGKGTPPPGAAPAIAGGPPPPAAPADKPAAEADAKGTST